MQHSSYGAGVGRQNRGVGRTEPGEKGRKGERKGEEKREERREERGREREKGERERGEVGSIRLCLFISNIYVYRHRLAHISRTARIRALGVWALERAHPGLAIGGYHNGQLTHGACICAIQGICMKGSMIYGIWNGVNELRWRYWGVFRGQREEIRGV